MVPQGQTLMATTHYPLAHRVQNHALDVATPQRTYDTIFLNIESNQVPSCILVPKQMAKDKVDELIPKR